MTKSQERALTLQTDCEIRLDDLTRQLYATDASVYQIEPAGVAFPRSSDEAASVVQAAVSEAIPVIPRGAGTGLTGGAIGSGLVVDFARYNRTISEFDRERQTVRVDPGVVLDQLNAFAKLHGLCFGPDVATSSRATLGGMIGNNSSGARAPIYGTTVEHVVSLDIVLTDGRAVTVGDGHDSLPEIHSAIGELVKRHAAIIDERFPEGLMKRWPGYGFDRWLRSRADLTTILTGSEGTLAAVVSAELKLSPLPKQKSIGVLFFASIAEAMEATVEILEFRPAAIEHIDRVLFDQTRGQRAFARARTLLRLDDEPCEALLLVEFYDDTDGRLDTLMERNIGLRRSPFTNEADMEQVWALRKAGLSLLMGCKGPAKPTAGIEDIAVMPERLPEYVAGLQSLMAPLGLEGSFYGHAASGLLHVRPVVDLHDAEDLAKYRQLASEVSALVKQFKGSIAAEHGVGMARAEFLADHLGPELMDALRQVKELFDPKDLMNPGKIFPDGGFTIDGNLRQGANHRIELPFDPVLAFAAKDGCFTGNLEQCNGCGGCRKDAPTMCPTYIATGEEIMSTRGRANTIRAALEGRLDQNGSPLTSPGLAEALDSCLACKACTTECPSNVNMALLKAELLHARQNRDGLSIGQRLLSRVDLLGRLGSAFPRLTNGALRSGPIRAIMEKVLGVSMMRPLPPYALQRFDRWFAAHERTEPPTRGPVILWDDCFVRHNEPHIGAAAVRVLEAAGFDVTLLEGRACCGRPAFSMGRLDVAAEFGKQNMALLGTPGDERPIIFLEPSCYSMFSEDYRELGVDGAENAAKRSFLFEQFIQDLLEREPDAVQFKSGDLPVAIHTHCHAKALTDAGVSATVARHVPDTTVTLLNSGCCGMAGAFGAMADKYDLSVKIAQPLIEQLEALPLDTVIVASGTSCRHQIGHLHGKVPLHLAEFLDKVLENIPATQT